jgi:hypothetical protein
VVLLDFEAQFNRLADSCNQLVERLGLGMTAVKLWHGGDVVSVGIALDQDIVLALHMAIVRASKQP